MIPLQNPTPWLTMVSRCRISCIQSINSARSQPASLPVGDSLWLEALSEDCERSRKPTLFPFPDIPFGLSCTWPFRFYGCGSKKLAVVLGTLANGTKDENLRFFGGLILTHTHMESWGALQGVVEGPLRVPWGSSRILAFGSLGWQVVWIGLDVFRGWFAHRAPLQERGNRNPPDHPGHPSRLHLNFRHLV